MGVSGRFYSRSFCDGRLGLGVPSGDRVGALVVGEEDVGLVGGGDGARDGGEGGQQERRGRVGGRDVVNDYFAFFFGVAAEFTG